jgi:hypothetical protein
MSETYKSSRQKIKNQKKVSPPEWAIAFLDENFQRASSSILDSLRKLERDQQTVLEQCAVRVLADPRLRRIEKLRNGAVRLIVALLPETFPTLKKLLSDCSTPLWHEVHFVAFSALDRSDLSETDQIQVLALVEQYLMNVKSDAGFAAWKAGDMLGDEWYTPETLQILEKLVPSARYVAGRKGALHGIQHAMDEATPSEMTRIRSLLRKVASEDPSAEVRRYATYTLEDGGCHGWSKRTPPPGHSKPPAENSSKAG